MGSRFIDMTPTWPEAVEMLLAVMENGTPEGVEMAKAEFRRLGQIAQSVQEQSASRAQSWTATELKDAMGYSDEPMSSLSIRVNGQPIPGNSIIEVIQC